MAKAKLSMRTLVVAAALLLLLGAVAAALWLVPRMPLTGPREHDFGEVPIQGIASNVAASLTFTNSSSEAVKLGPVKPTCSCVNARVDRSEVEPGGELTLHIGMKLVDSARKDVTVNMLVEGHGVLSVELTARGRRQQQISAGQREITLAQGDSFITTVSGEVWAADTHDPPVVNAPAGLKATIEDWTEQKRANPEESRPAVYGGRLTIRAANDAPLGQHELALGGLGDAPCTIRVTVK